MFLQNVFSKTGMCLRRCSVQNKIVARYLCSNLSSNSETGDGFEREMFEQRSRSNETVEKKRARLLYQSRKRGKVLNSLMLNCPKT